MTASPRTTFRIGSRQVGGGAPPFVIAEIGANHDGDVAKAHRLVDACADAGAEAVKFQTYTAAELLADGDRMIRWGRAGHEVAEAVGPMFDRLALPRSAHAELFAHAKERGMLAFSTPFSLDALEFLVGLGVPALKIASSDVNWPALLRAAGASGLPVIFSRGKSTLGELDAAMQALRAGGARDIALLHCLAQYPAPSEEMNLRAIGTLASLYPDVVVGLSDHSVGTVAAVAAVALGAEVIEKHVTLDTDDTGPDHWFSADPDELHRLIASVREAHAMRGDGTIGIAPCEAHERHTSVRSLVVRHPLAAGTIVTADDLVALRPGWGIAPIDEDKVIGRRVREATPEGTVLTWDRLG
jgi:N,N'-diacetyllegionaminate synthase